jgi:hypothetical protein
MSTTVASPWLGEAEAAEAERPARDPALVETGKAYVTRFLTEWRQHHARGFRKIAAEAQEAEGADGRRELYQAFKDAELAAKQLPPNTKERFAADHVRDTLFIRCEKVVPLAADAARQVFYTPRAVKLIRDDLRQLRDAIVAEQDRIIARQVKFCEENGWGLNVIKARSISPEWHALEEFHHRHLIPTLGNFEFKHEDFNSCAGIQIENASWPLLGCGWRQVNLD